MNSIIANKRELLDNVPLSKRNRFLVREREPEQGSGNRNLNRVQVSGTMFRNYIPEAARSCLNIVQELTPV